MDKKKFFEPEVKVVELDDQSIVCASPVEEPELPGGGDDADDNI